MGAALMANHVHPSANEQFNSRVRVDLPRVWSCQERVHASRCLQIFLRVQETPDGCCWEDPSTSPLKACDLLVPCLWGLDCDQPRSTRPL